MARLATQILTPIVHRFINDWVTSISSYPGDPPMPEMKHMMRVDPVAGLCVQLNNLYILAAMGDYTHKRKRIEKQVRGAIAQSKGIWKQTLAQLLSFIPYGRSFGEVAYIVEGKAVLREIRVLDPEHYYFEGTKGEVTKVVYKSVALTYSDLSGTTPIDLDYNKGIHLTNEPHLAFGDPLGIPAAVRAYPYWKLHQILMPILSVAAQRQATPILVYKTKVDEKIELFDANGQPLIGTDGEPMSVSKGYEAIKALEGLSNAGAMAIDLDETVDAIAQKVDANFLMQVLKTCEQYRMMSFLVPSTIASFSSSGVGDAGLAESQREVFEAICASRAQQLGEALIEQVIKPMIRFNFGDQEDYGEFPVNTKDPAALQVAELITQAVQRGAFTTEDVTAIARLKDILGIEEDEQPKIRKPRNVATPEDPQPQADPSDEEDLDPSDDEN